MMSCLKQETNTMATIQFIQQLRISRHESMLIFIAQDQKTRKTIWID